MLNLKNNRFFAPLLLLHLFVQASFVLAPSNVTLSLNGSIEPSLSINISNISRPNNSDFFYECDSDWQNHLRIEMRGTGLATEKTARTRSRLPSCKPQEIQQIPDLGGEIWAQEASVPHRPPFQIRSSWMALHFRITRRREICHFWHNRQ
jgi:hypothetical protein